MTSISQILPTSEYAPSDQEKEQSDIKPIQDHAMQEIQTPSVQNEESQQDTKTTLNAFQYTGKGSFIDRVF